MEGEVNQAAERLRRWRHATIDDIGKTVEVAIDETAAENNRWLNGKLNYIANVAGRTMFGIESNNNQFRCCRVPFDTANPQDQLAVAADFLADHGMDLAAEVLRHRISLL